MPKLYRFPNLIAPWTNLSVRRQGSLVVAIPMLCLLGSLGAFSWLRSSIDESQKWVNHTDQVLLASKQILLGLLNAETGVRGYALTRRDQFLEPYHLAQNTLPENFKQLKQLVVENPSQRQQIEAIEQLSLNRLTTLSDLVSQVNRSDSNILPTSRLKQLIDQGKNEMDALRLKLAEFDGAEQRLLQAHRYRLEQQRSMNELALWLAASVSALGLVVALSLFYQLERNLREREQTLRESRRLFQAVVANVIDGVVILDGKGQIETFNAAAETMFGYQLTEVIGQNISILLADPFTGDCDQDPDQTAAHLLNVGQQWQTLGCRKSKEPFPIELSVSQFDLDSQQMIIIIRDITERQQAEAKLQAHADQLEQLNLVLSATNTMLKDRNRELDQFAYVASHDLKAPLRAIANLSEWIEEDLNDRLSTENQQQMHLLRARVQRMDALINGLLEYSRVGRAQISTESVDVRTLLTEVIDTLSPPSSFKVVIEPDMPTLITRKLLLKQVFSNLIDNTIKHHPHPEGSVQIAVQDQGSRYEFAVSDDGHGIDPRYHEKIFVIFQTLEARDTLESTGIGLAIVKKIIETEGGTIRLDSEQGQGTTFYFTWPKSAF
ncbi:MAG: PAS domain S-box protein [Acaryochloris sp. RU_4_1]|nr:PAS domain S-box protein [Acaryochloris sp. RU_4_1]